MMMFFTTKKLQSYGKHKPNICVGFMLEGVFLFNIVVFLLIKDFMFTNVCFEYQNSTGNGS